MMAYVPTLDELNCLNFSRVAPRLRKCPSFFERGYRAIQPAIEFRNSLKETYESCSEGFSSFILGKCYDVASLTEILLLEKNIESTRDFVLQARRQLPTILEAMETCEETFRWYHKLIIGKYWDFFVSAMYFADDLTLALEDRLDHPEEMARLDEEILGNLNK